MKIDLKDFISGALSIEKEKDILEELITVSGAIFNKNIFTEHLLKDMELVMEIISNLTTLNGEEYEELQRLIARYCLYCYSSGMVYGTTTCFNQEIDNTTG